MLMITQVVLPVVARKKGLEGYFENTNPHIQQKKRQANGKAEELIAPVSIPLVGIWTYANFISHRHLGLSDMITPNTDHGSSGMTRKGETSLLSLMSLG